jgi:hypothetical protein
MNIARIKIITSRAPIKTTGTFIVIMAEPIQKTPILQQNMGQGHLGRERSVV